MSSRPELALPIADTRATRMHLGAALQRLVRDLQRLALPRSVEGDDARTILSHLSRLSRSTPGVVWAALRRPSVYAHLRLAADGMGTTQLSTGLATLAAELAAAGALEAPLVLHAPPPRLIVRSRRRRFAIDPQRALRLERDGSLWQGLAALESTPSSVPIVGGIDLSLVDDNPLASVEAHPDKSGSQLDLGQAAAAAWVASLRDALDRVERHLPLLRLELDLVVSCFVPVGTDPERHVSASYREALGLVYLSLHPDPLTMTEAVVHEAQHQKLNAVLASDPLLENDPDERYPSPVRPDPRPIFGVLLAVHAFVPVAVLYAAMRSGDDPLGVGARAAERARAIVQGNHEGLSLLERHARPTSLGRALLGELRVLHDEAASRLA